MWLAFMKGCFGVGRVDVYCAGLVGVPAGPSKDSSHQMVNGPGGKRLRLWFRVVREWYNKRSERV